MLCSDCCLPGASQNLFLVWHLLSFINPGLFLEDGTVAVDDLIAETGDVLDTGGVLGLAPVGSYGGETFGLETGLECTLDAFSEVCR